MSYDLPDKDGKHGEFLVGQVLPTKCAQAVAFLFRRVLPGYFAFEVWRNGKKIADKLIRRYR